MNRYKLTKAGVNPNEGIARMGGKIEFYEKMLNRFPTDDHYDGMIHSIEAGDVENAFQYAHALKGIAGNMSMTALYEAVVPLVDELRAGSMEHVPELLAPVTVAYEKAVEAIGPNEGE